MKVYRQDEIKPGQFDRTVCALGNFDGVHLGHRRILDRLEAAKQELGLPSIVYTFEPHPVRVLNPKKNLRLIFDYPQRIELLRKANPDALVVAHFTLELAHTPAETFVNETLFKLFGVRKVVVGYDFNFGRGGDGNAQHLTKLGKELGFEVEQVPAVKIGEKTISSSRIRRLIQAGEIRMVNEMLGRPFHLVGNVVKGTCRGGSVLGIPTANLSTQQELIPAKGVYAAMVRIPQGFYASAVNVGCNPTFDNGALSVEAHILDFSGDLYDEEIEIHFLQRLRDEKRFDSVERLGQQMRKDIDVARQITRDVKPENFDR